MALHYAYRWQCHYAVSSNLRVARCRCNNSAVSKFHCYLPERIGSRLEVGGRDKSNCTASCFHFFHLNSRLKSVLFLFPFGRCTFLLLVVLFYKTQWSQRWERQFCLCSLDFSLVLKRQENLQKIFLVHIRFSKISMNWVVQ